jgi:hypothetical protein
MINGDSFESMFSIVEEMGCWVCLGFLSWLIDLRQDKDVA